MKLSFLRPLYERPGPWASVYLDVSRDTEDAAKAVDLRWRRLRDELAGQGADAATLDAAETALRDADPRPGRSGLSIFASGGTVVLAEPLAGPPPRDLAVWSGRPQV